MQIAALAPGEEIILAELRRHPVSEQWVVICPEKKRLVRDDGGDGCIYCPGNESMTGHEIYRSDGANGSGGSNWRIRVVAESLPLFHIEGDFCKQAAGICDRMEAIGAHEVVIENPCHNIEFEDLPDDQMFAVVDVLRMRALDLSKDPRLRQVFTFKVRTFGENSGTSHPRWHVVSMPFVPTLIKEELKGSAKYFSYKERCVLCDYIRQERKVQTRLICEDTDFVAISPYAARFPFEVWVLPLRHSADFHSLLQPEISSLGRILRKLLKGLRRLPQAAGYVASIHTAPFRKPKADAWKTIALDYHWHIEIRPRVDLLNGLKESGGFHLNPVAPEEAAKVISDLCS
jgi:UDPglucose--hexose-1-phosphate uridylyltransferase